MLSPDGPPRVAAQSVHSLPFDRVAQSDQTGASLEVEVTQGPGSKSNVTDSLEIILVLYRVCSGLQNYL